MSLRRRTRAALGVPFLVFVASCGGSSGGTSSPATDAVTTTTTTAVEVTTPATEVPSGAISSIDDVKTATVQILAQGSYRDPAEGQQSTFGSGSGFIIDPSGIIVTNNHVVTGAGAVEVLVGGSTEEIPAKILGVSECNDLAVLQLADPGDYPYLEWFEGDVQPPAEVYTAGFPLGDPEFTITKGIVSKAKADGDTNWASVRSVLEHDANIQPGNSGGPLVNPEGKLLGINYAGGDPGTGTAQFFAISRDIAEPVVEQLKSGDAETIGVNGQAFVDTDLGLAGVWVGAVSAGSPAAKVGLQPGDVITSMNGVQLASGTMKEYCDVLRTANTGDAIGIKVIRFDTQVGLEGELNGPPLTERYSFAEQVESAGEAPAAAGTNYSGYQTVTDDSGRLSVELPVEWTDIQTGAQDLGLSTGPAPAITASPNLADPTLPSMAMFAIDGATGIAPDSILDGMTITGCTETDRQDYADAIVAGRFATQTCDDGSVVVSIVATSLTNPDLVVLLTVVAFTDADLQALDRMAASFVVS